MTGATVATQDDRETEMSRLTAGTERERHAEATSLRNVLAPESIVVIGASRRRGTAGRAILDNIRAAGYAGRLYTEPRGQLPGFADIRAADARRLAREFACQASGGGRLSRAAAAELLDCYGIPLAAGPADDTGIIVRVIADRASGPLVAVGPGSLASGVLARQPARLAPLTDTDADNLIHPLRSASALSGAGGRPAAGLEALRDLLLRVSRLAADVPEVVDLDLSPVAVRPDGVTVTNARITMTPYQPQDPFLRTLR